MKSASTYLFVQSFLDGDTSIVTHHASKWCAILVQRAIRGQHCNELQVVALSTFVIICKTWNQTWLER